MKKKIIWKVVALVVLVGTVFLVKFGLDMKEYNSITSSLSNKEVNIAEVADGKYEGTFDAKIVAATVKLKVESGTLIDVQLIKHKNDRGQAAEKVVNDMLEENSILVDVVSGASDSSRIIMKAAENALTQSLN